ncbi:MAG: glycosyltransferase family 2 protein [Alphaproteobacteria bacterium]
MTNSISIIVPLFNEAANIAELHRRIIAALDGGGNPFEVIYIDDGSTDETDKILGSIAASDTRSRIISLTRNFGQTAAMMAGIDNASNDVIIPMDGDLQNDPVDIPRLIEKLDEGFDVVSGWRKDRKDPWLTKKFPSQMANKLISWVTGVRLRDYGCTLKAYRRSSLEGVRLYGEMHRFIPIYASWRGGKVTELPVSHHPRRHGKSNYGLGRVFKVLMDLLVVRFLERYATKPIYVFGMVGMGSIVFSLVSGFYAVYLKLFEGTSFIQTPLPLLVVMSFITGIMCILMGLIAEILTRTYFESQEKKTYGIKNMLNFD